ncbi:acyl-CoA ligase (AMP-forming), exosortase A system-associated [Sphingorhabdus sp. Alg239-R122]|uniref:acyl-CoA ligase (AMP-forming), exosortase A system-associated n=1 Tax=Sphingorhabdus sp. Alg239-R122 TaxID=2305989 RepID=UPI001F0754E3|nr:acyl-CoA ligase (AMP-forming), exosortase A system-associated [Sphingorhabdus sp. Alg239-R122]
MHQSKKYTPTVPQAKPLDHLVLSRKTKDSALKLRDETLDYGALDCRVGQLAHWLLEQGFAAGDRVATWLPKTETACIMPLATARAGLVHVPINPLLKHAQVAHILADSGAKCLISNTSRLKSLGGGDVPDSCALHDEKPAMEVWKAVKSPLGPSDAAPDDLVAILYTSGSTGQPKGVMLSHANLWLGAVSVAGYLNVTADDRTLCVMPLSFDYGQNQLLSTWYAGGCCVPLDYLTPRDVIKACAKHEITTLGAIPPLWVQLVEQEWPAAASAPLRRLTNTGGALTERLVRQLRAIFCDADIYAMYGLTEAFRSTYLDPALIDDNPLSIGKAIPFAEIMVVNDAGEKAGPEEEGELVHAGPLVAQGYWQDSSRTAERFRPAPGFSEFGGMAVWSGDRVRRDRDGLIYFVGRRDAMIKSSGNRISPAEVENTALDTGLVAETVALGIAHARLGHEIVLFVRPQMGQGLDTEQLRRILKKELPNFMVPHHIIALESFPKNPNGKLDRTVLKKIAEEQIA